MKKHSTAQHSTAQHSTAQHSTAQHSTAQHSTAQHIKWLLIAVVLVCSFFVPISAQKAKAEGVARASYVNGFNDQFTANNGNWASWSGSWSYKAGVVRGLGQKDKTSGIEFTKAQYSNFEYQVRMKRVGCATCTNELYIRSSTVGTIYYGYTNSGFFTIYSCNSVSCFTWQSFKASPKIIKGGFNTLKVLAINNNYQFYINNSLVSSGTVSGPLTLMKKGYVGIDFYSASATGNSLDVEFAILVKK
jgi:hypothetical protein